MSVARRRSINARQIRRKRFLATCEQVEERVLLAAFVVTSNGDSATTSGTLRFEINAFNTTGTFGDQITFNLPANQLVITPQSPLPALSNAVVIDGTTEAAFLGKPATVIIDGSGAGTLTTGLLTLGADSDGSTIKGLDIIGAKGPAIDVQSNGNTIVGNELGFDVTGQSANPANQIGIQLDNAEFNTIGGTSTAAANVISGNTSAGILITGFLNVVEGNLIGTDTTGTAHGPGSQTDGIRIDGGASSNQIGDTVSGAGNVIAFNTGSGVNVVSGSANSIRGNSIFQNGTGITVNTAGTSPANNDTLPPTLNSATLDASSLTVSGQFTAPPPVQSEG